MRSKARAAALPGRSDRRRAAVHVPRCRHATGALPGGNAERTDPHRFPCVAAGAKLASSPAMLAGQRIAMAHEQPTADLNLLTAFDSAEAEHPHSDQTWRGIRLRWWGLAAGLATGIFDTAFLSLLGVEFAINGWDARPLIAAYFGATF